MTLRRQIFFLLLVWAPAAAFAAGLGLYTRPTAAAPAPTTGQTLRADRIVIWKAKRRLELFYKGRMIKRYRIALGFNPKGHKVRQGDGRTPEGTYRIDLRNPRSRFHLSLRISYPNARDRKRAKSRGFSPGGDIYIHGQPNRLAALRGRLPGDWTLGCVALTNREMREIWRAVKTGTPVEIKA